MADYNAPSSGPPDPQYHQTERSGSMSLGNDAPAAAAEQQEHEKAEASNAANGGAVQATETILPVRSSKDEGPRPTATKSGAPTSINPEMQKRVSEVLASEHGVPTLLNRLKQSIASAKEFALFLQKRAILEEDHSRGLKKLCRTTQENMHRPDHREGSFVIAYDEMMVIHDRMAENAVQFAQSLHQMHDDLVELATVAERNRKGWKTNALAAEQKVADLEAAMRKSKTKYDSLADEYDRARTGEGRQGGRVLGAFKQKSAAQVEEDLLRKVQMADQTYHGAVLALQGDKSALESSTRPEAVRALQDIAKETDAGLLLQMQKFAAFNEKLLLSNGLVLSPMKGPNGEPSGRSLRQTVLGINNDQDLHSYVSSYHSMIRPNTAVTYERHPVLNPQSQSPQFNQGPPQQPMQASQQTMGQYPQQPQQQSPPQQHTFSMGSRTGTGNFGPAPGSPQGQTPQSAGGYQASGALGSPQQPYAQPHNRSFSQGNMIQSPSQGQPGPQQSLQAQQPYNARHSAQPGQYSSPVSQTGPPQLGALAFQGQGSPTSPQNQPMQNSTASPVTMQPPRGPLNISSPTQIGGPQGRMPSPQTSHAAPTKPVFGVNLDHLYERDGLAVPMVVYQCMQAVDLFGLGVEGIYRQSGSLAHVQKLKAMFDHDSQNKALDFRNPENFYHDVNSVTGLLKMFFRDLPDPLLTSEHHDSLIAAAKHDDDIVRRDSLHAIINSLPDPNYATLRAISLHLYRVIENSHVNRMNSHNLAVIFGPTLMGSDPSTAIADAGWQIKVIDTILQNTYQIFDED